jgi:hypothetical protein
MALMQEFPKSRLIAVDPWIRGGDFSTEFVKLEQVTKAREEFLANTDAYKDRIRLLEMTSEMAAGLIHDQSIGVVFIDACHTYEHVNRDVRLWMRKVAPRGILCGHDYDGVGDRTGKFGVKRAVNEIASEFGYNVETRPGHVWWWRMK